MKSLATGKSTFRNSEITAITNLGFYILIGDKEYLVPFSEYPAFRQCSVDAIYDYEMLSPKQIYWKALDCDIELDALQKPEHYPLLYKK